MNFNQLYAVFWQVLAGPDGTYECRKWKSVEGRRLRATLAAEEMPGFQTIEEKIAALRYGLQYRPVCTVCGSTVRLHPGSDNGFRRTCSVRCAARDEHTKEKTRGTLDSRYGGHHTQNKEWMTETVTAMKSAGSYSKAADTLEKKIGVRSVFALDSVKKKIKNTNEKRYGVENPMQNENIAAAARVTTLERHGSFFNPAVTKDTNMKKYGVDNPLKNELIKEKVKTTTLERHGSFFNPAQTRQTLLEKYGVTTTAHIPGLKDRARKKQRETIFHRIKNKLETTARPLFSMDDFTSVDEMYPWECIKCGNHFSSRLCDGTVPRCLVCNPISRRGLENEIRETLEKRYGISLSSNRSILNGKEIDLYSEELKIGIEVNGTYWHSSVFKPPQFHQEKVLQARAAGVKLIHIYEDAWVSNRDAIISNLDTVFHYNISRVYARSCEIRAISERESADFLRANHLSSNCMGAKVRIGLFHDGALLSVMTFGKPRFNKRAQWELLRYCTARGRLIVGGASKLLTYFEKCHKPTSLLTYADLDFSDGRVYERCGFTEIGNTVPGYFYVDKNGNRISRLAATKKILNDRLGNSDALLSEAEAAEELGLLKIHNAGNLIFIKEYTQSSPV